MTVLGEKTFNSAAKSATILLEKTFKVESKKKKRLLIDKVNNLISLMYLSLEL